MPKLLAPTACAAGVAGTFPCHNIDYLAQVQLQEIPGAPTSASEIWGLVDRDDNREYAILGHRSGTAIYDVTVPGYARAGRQHSGQPVVVARSEGLSILRRRARPASRVCVRDHGSAGRRPADHRSHQSADQRLARRTRSPSSAPRTRCTSRTSSTRRNAAAAGQHGLSSTSPAPTSAAARSASTASRIPIAPTLVTPPPAGTGYMHDSTSMLITDNRTTQCANAHNPCEVLVDFNETSGRSLGRDGQGRARAAQSTTTYPTASYVHSGWPTADNMFIVVHDELDELRRGLNTQHLHARHRGPARPAARDVVHRRPPARPITTATPSATAITSRTTNAGS